MRILVLFLSFIVSAANAQTVSVFGLPLGGKIQPPEVCKNTDEHETLCWRDAAPSDYYKSGLVFFKAGSVPIWVNDGNASIKISSTDLLNEIFIVFDGQVSKSNTEAVASIRARFGKPSKTGYFNGRGYTNWALSNVVINTGFDIYTNWGYVQLKSIAYDKEDREFQKKLPKTPITP